MKSEDLILITNDDGFKAKGIKVLKSVAEKLSKNVWEFSPSSNNSGKSHSITINKKIKIKQLNNKVFVINGTPVDCIIFGDKYLSRKKMKPSIILSGVNHGQNMGADLFYSGTVAAAREGSILGIRSFSISLEKNKQPSNWNTVLYYLPKILTRIKKINLKTDIFCNINFPNKDIKKIKGCKVVRLGKRKPGELSKIIKVKENNFYFLVPSERRMHKTAKVNEDEYEMKKSFITITFHSNLNEKVIERKLANAVGKNIEK
ncbi:MAG: 5'/3'-nucleotidase SurE [Alphaproteobacteria bacterium TMED93]|nr:MAG: 5'/3'-nucleotidase SurE [Alphaproteobacteria bacterium TMED93]